MVYMQGLLEEEKVDSLKKEWQLWAKIIGKDTGLGWDGEKKTIAASDEWWEAKVQVCIIQRKQSFYAGQSFVLLFFYV